MQLIFVQLSQIHCNDNGSNIGRVCQNSLLDPLEIFSSTYTYSKPKSNRLNSLNSLSTLYPFFIVKSTSYNLNWDLLYYHP